MDPERPAGPEERILAVDYGTKRIGLALGYLPQGAAVPLVTLDRAAGGPAPEERIAGLAREEGATRLLVGLPLNMDGTEGPSARAARAFGARVGRAAGLPVVFVDERLTSEAAAERAREAGLRTKRLDDLAAQILLEAWMRDEQARAARLRYREPGDGA